MPAAAAVPSPANTRRRFIDKFSSFAAACPFPRSFLSRMSPVGEAIERASGADEDAISEESGGGEAFFVQTVDRKRLPLPAGLHHYHMTRLADHIELSRSRYRRSKILIKRPIEPGLPEHFS